MRNIKIKLRSLIPILAIILAITLVNFNVYGYSYEKIYYEIEKKYDYLSRSTYTTTEDYIVAMNGISLLNNSIFIYNRTDRSFDKKVEIEINSTLFNPKIIAGNTVSNFTKNIIFLVGSNSMIILWNLSSGESIKMFNYFYLAQYNIKDAYFYGDTIFIVSKDSTGDFFLFILNLNLEIIDNYLLGDDEYYDAHLIGKEYLLTILLDAEWNAEIPDNLYIYNISLPMSGINQVCSIEDIKWSAISIQNETIFIANDRSIFFYDLYNYSLLGTYDIELMDPLSGFDLSGCSIRHILFYNGLLVLDIFDTSTIYFFDYTNRCSLIPIGVISGTDIFIIYDYDFLERDILIVSEEYELAFIFFDINREKKSMLDNFGIDIQASLWIIILIIGVSLGLLVLSKKNK
ncbi:MAG: hypothetical protein GF329_16235 [Candidatus Lokiarchaeota archaeon]|nr:hypothetical protein [Candidatus Lokiarchaeota archaeon]